MRVFKTEDEVRDEMKALLGFNKKSEGVKQGTGQLTTFNKLGFPGVYDKPDGWYLPQISTEIAIVCEAKNSDESVEKNCWIDACKKNSRVVESKYQTVIGLLYNGYELKVFKNGKEISNECSSTLEDKEYYIELCTDLNIDKNLIYNLTARINNTLHFDFGIKNLYHRMIFTACALVAIRYGAKLSERGVKKF